MPQKLSVLLPVKNERANIRSCIESVRDVADEILVADSGSEDDTLEIVRSLGGCRIIERDFRSYASFKNWALDHASHPWVLIVDADERLTPELTREIRKKLQTTPPHVDGYWIHRRGFFMGHEIRYGVWGTDKAFRLFRRDRCRYQEGLVHEQIHRPRRQVGKLRHSMLHYTYWSYDQFLDKHIRYTKLGALEKWGRGEHVTFVNLLFRPFLRFVWLYLVRLGFLDGLPGLQVCFLQAFFITFFKQARLWEMEFAKAPPAPKPEAASQAA